MPSLDGYPLTHVQEAVTGEFLWDLIDMRWMGWLANDDDTYRDTLSDIRMVTMNQALEADVFCFEFPRENYNGIAPIHESIVRSTLEIGNTRTPFLGYYGMSQFKPTHIYPTIEHLPPYLQTFDYCFRDKVVFDAGYLSNMDPDHKLKLAFMSASDKTLTLESKQTFEQEDKELMRISMNWPRVEQFQSSERTDANNHADPPFRITVPFSTILGKPDYIFIRARRNAADNYQPLSTTDRPTVIKVKCFLPEHGDIKTLSRLEKEDLEHITRKNSNFRADHAENRNELGAVLLSQEDCAGFNHFHGIQDVDRFEGNFTVDVVDYSRGMADEWTGEYIGLVDFYYLNHGITGEMFDAKFQIAPNFRDV